MDKEKIRIIVRWAIIVFGIWAVFRYLWWLVLLLAVIFLFRSWKTRQTVSQTTRDTLDWLKRRRDVPIGEQVRRKKEEEAEVIDADFKAHQNEGKKQTL